MHMLLICALGTLIGASALSFCSVLPSVVSIAILLTLTGFCHTICILKIPSKAVKNLSMLALSMVIGLSWAWLTAYQKLQWQLPENDSQRVITLEGKVVGVTYFAQHALRFKVQVEKYDGQSIQKNTQVIFKLFWPKASTTLQENDRIHCQVKLTSPWHLANPGSFDQERQLFIEGIQATGKVVNMLDYEVYSGFSLNKLRQNLSQRMTDLLGNKSLLGVIQAMTLGINHNIPPEQWKIFQATGTTHIISISGSHIGLVAMLCFNLVVRLIKRSIRLTVIMPAQYYGAIVAICSATIYSALAGFSVPTVRACIMTLVCMWAVIKKQPILSWHTLALSWLGIFIWDPLATLQMGFWLSFGCVAVLIFGGSYYQGLSRWRKWIMPQWIVFIGILPLCMVFFQQAPLLSPVANFVILPIVSFIVVPPSLLGLCFLKLSQGLATLCLELAHMGLVVFLVILENIAAVPWSVWEKGQMPLLPTVLTFIGTIILLSPKGIPARNVAWCVFLPLVFYHPVLLEWGECKFTLLDVGQGLAAVIQTRNHVLLYDAGPQYGNDDAGNRVIKPFLLKEHIKVLNKVIISHSDLDHRAGLTGLQKWPMQEIISSEPERLTVLARPCIAGEQWEWDGVQFMMLGPPPEGAKKRNNLSCVLKVSTAQHSILLTGDIETLAEIELLQSYPEYLRSDILVVPHHGSLTSSSPAFIAKVAPHYALYPVGKDNRYGFPKAAILERYADLGAINMVSSQTGACTFYLKPEGALEAPRLWRKVSKRYWHKA